MSEEFIQMVTQAVLLTLQEKGLLPKLVPVGISARHLHLSRQHVDILFGEGYQLTQMKPLSQPGQFAAVETVELVGPKGNLPGVRVLGPERPQSQVELACSDARRLGIDAPVRSSGSLAGTPGITLRTARGEVVLDSGVIIADRHIHMTPAEGEAFGVANGQKVQVAVPGDKGGVMDGVTVRISDQYALDFHVDTDDANAFLLKQGQLVTMIGQEEA